ncbi:Zinc finger MIZ domain-containing protein-like protein [Hapsidospora chrysogenum ATCC 11550]|uniref:Zinc finger MIZ domain-containing protein-like protein n=1 Tax=Hapsidospora chrysogenum (strain ATCC 11550 / CBS 779.69 / DSM 880 / IAM 14645 / JCM 23072 / IMI 49137) TaxID=857340 RepID=A0A086TBW9_HAPC1|nr:Zinc finger MIZ domain-containing protein-like protein [Hapsidospora chrysogenum ATCC 11550]
MPLLTLRADQMVSSTVFVSSKNTNFRPLRSPERKPGRGVSGRFYQYVTKCAVQPTRMDPRSGIRTLEFTLPAGAAALLPQKATGITELPIRSYTEGCIRLRLRCSRRPKRETYVRDSDWAISDTTWPGEMYTFFNETAIELPRKQHFRHDRPAELTDLAVEGPNVVKISLPDNKCNLSEDSTFFLAVEVVLTASRSFLENGVRAARHTTAEETKKKIARRLTSTSPDDDVVAADTTLSISLADPFSATMVEVPVRGVDCEHMECFDLGNWLASRPSKKSGGGEPSLADCWKCPICGRDARPHRLHIDDFLVEVRAELLADGKQRTKRIQVAADGSWVPVAEPEDSDDEGDAPPPSGPAQESSRVSSRSVPPAAAVIEILDDD